MKVGWNFTNLFIQGSTYYIANCFSENENILIFTHTYSNHFSAPWWRHEIEETYSMLLAICAGNGEFPAQRPVKRSFDVLFDLYPNKQLSKQWWGWWFETPSCPLWRHCNGYDCTCSQFFIMSDENPSIDTKQPILWLIMVATQGSHSPRIFWPQHHGGGGGGGGGAGRGWDGQLTHWGWGKMDAILQKTFSNGIL